jgi:hypothetical protein
MPTDGDGCDGVPCVTSRREHNRSLEKERATMQRIRQQDLPFVGMSHEFVGAAHGNVGISVGVPDAQRSAKAD